MDISIQNLSRPAGLPPVGPVEPVQAGLPLAYIHPENLVAPDSGVAAVESGGGS